MIITKPERQNWERNSISLLSSILLSCRIAFRDYTPELVIDTSSDVHIIKGRMKRQLANELQWELNWLIFEVITVYRGELSLQAYDFEQTKITSDSYEKY